MIQVSCSYAHRLSLNSFFMYSHQIQNKQMFAHNHYMEKKGCAQVQKNEFGKLIAEERKKQGLSQPQLAEMTGFSDRTISLWETGKRGITITSADKVAKALGFTVTIGAS